MVNYQLGLEPETVVHRVEGDAEVTELADSGYTSTGASQDEHPGHIDVAGLYLSGGRMIPGKLSLVLPAHNEIDNIPEVTGRALEVLPELCERFEIIVVDDGSTDGTGAVLDQMAVQHPEVKPVHHPRNRGYGAALTSGFVAATGEHIMFMDADLQFDIADLSHLAPFVSQYDIVAGYRIDRQDASYRIVYADIFKLAVRILFGIRMRDIDCAFKVFRADLLKPMRLESPGALINTEILAKAARAHAKHVEVGVHHYPRKRGESSGGSPRVVFRAMMETILLWGRMRSYVPVTTGNHDARSRAFPGVPLFALSGLGVALAAAVWSRLIRRRPK